jgi:TetR/AcrR family transcriptional regulator, cholesterol catabolism regulator
MPARHPVHWFVDRRGLRPGHRVSCITSAPRKPRSWVTSFYFDPELADSGSSTVLYVRSFMSVANDKMGGRRVPTPSARSSTPATRGKATRSRIEHEALSLFERQGFRTTTMREITAACGVTPAAFYNHFQSKDDLLLSIILSSFFDLGATVSAELNRVPDDASPRGRLSVIVKAMTSWHYRNIRRAQVTNREVLELPPPMLRQVRDQRHQLQRLLEAVIADGVAAGDLSLPDDGFVRPAVAAALILGIVQSLPASYAKTGESTPDGIATFVSALVIRMLAAP